MFKETLRGNLIVISGPSGCGKGAIANKLHEINHKIWYSVSMTTRNIRPGETEGKDYFYISKQEFEEKISNNTFLEWAVYNENYYGTPKDKIDEVLNQGYDVILEIEIQGALQIKEQVPNAVFIFIMPPSMSELKHRLEVRGTETKEEILRRFKKAYQEINEYTKYNYVVVNDDVDIASQKVNAIMLSERSRVDRIEEIYVDSSEEEIHESLIDREFVNKGKE